MRYVTLPDSKPRLLPFYLTMEEYVARRLPDGTDAFFMWQVDPTVIFGRTRVRAMKSTPVIAPPAASTSTAAAPAEAASTPTATT